MTYDPQIHHRRSIRLKGHDYAGGGVYFVTVCASGLDRAGKGAAVRFAADAGIDRPGMGGGRYRGRNGALACAAPPSEPYVRFSRIRLSG